MEAAVRFSQNSVPTQPDQHFLKIDVAGRVLELYNIAKRRKHGTKYDLIHTSHKLPPFRAFDWHPLESTLVAIGQTSGEASLVNLAAGKDSTITFTVRSPRSCNAVGTNTQNWLAAGLEKVRNDFCLNIWDLNQRLSPTNEKSYGKSNEPLYKLAGGEPITSLRFFQDQPRLLAAGVKGQFVRLYDLREPIASSALQFATKCVNNIAVDSQDENYLASCLPANVPTVSIWDRRMIARTSAPQYAFSNYVSQADQHPESSLEMKNVVDPKGHIWGLRFSKTQRGHLGVLSSTGQMRMLKLGLDNLELVPINEQQESRNLDWDKQQPQGVYLDNSQNFSNEWDEYPGVEEVKRIVSFDFTTSEGHGQTEIITLTGHGAINIERMKSESRSVVLTSSTSFHDAKGLVDPQRNNKTTMAPANQQEDRLDLLPHLRQRCEQGYLLDPSTNLSIVQTNEKLRALWSWLKHAKDITAHNAFVQGDIDLSYLGVFALWMEEIDIKHRSTHDSANINSAQSCTVLRDTARRLNLQRGKGCTTEYPANRALCLHVAGVAYTYDDIKHECNELVAADEHTKAAALALFSGEDKLAQQALRSKGASHNHTMLAMALLGASGRHRRLSGSRLYERTDNEPTGQQGEDWQDVVTALAEGLSDIYARAILTYVKSGDWEDVVKQDCMPLRYRIYIALRYFDDSKLTRYLSNTKNEVIATGNLEGILVTGAGTPESVELLKSYARISSDLQTTTLAMSFAAASDQYLHPDSPHMRTVECFRSIYKSQLMSLGLKFDKTRFEVALSRAIRMTSKTTPPRKREQIRLVCNHCNQSLSRFGHEQQSNELKVDMKDTVKHNLAPEKAAVAGVVCPKCARHLPRCGVCDLWLGTPDETFSKWYKPPSRNSQANSNGVDLSASMVGSTITAIGPQMHSNAPSISVTGTSAGSKKAEVRRITAADVPPSAIEVVDEEVAKQGEQKKWYEAMHRFTVFCMQCSHGFHAEHARMWFQGVDGREGHRDCPVPLCECFCNG
ncbi:hypothetical protein LTR64_004244 [Lithohypha guttulata]|uniref:uncharacterized protein n=1 Tax=Lithohypha guttulata TaxID=1690604 RepID=UPI00315DDA3A